MAVPSPSPGFIELGFTLQITVDADIAPMLQLSSCARVLEQFGSVAFLSIAGCRGPRRQRNYLEVRYFDFESVVQFSICFNETGLGALRDLLVEAHRIRRTEVAPTNDPEDLARTGVPAAASDMIPHVLPQVQEADTHELDASINVQRLLSGRETRCSVMVGQVPKTCTSVQFLEQLDHFGFLRRLRFFYLPLDISRRRGYGYLFLEFQSPADVLEFSEHLPAVGSRLMDQGQNKRLHLQYSRMQGWQNLMKHYGDSRHTFLTDANLRPQFLFPGAPRNRNASYRDLLPEGLRNLDA